MEAAQARTGTAANTTDIFTQRWTSRRRHAVAVLRWPVAACTCVSWENPTLCAKIRRHDLVAGHRIPIGAGRPRRSPEHGPLAEDLLGKHGKFYPFGGSISSQGEASLTAADPGVGEHPASDEVLAGLHDGARANAATLRAVAFVADVRANGSDAVQVELEHQEGEALVVLLPYTRSRFRKALAFGQMSVSSGQPRIWAAH